MPIGKHAPIRAAAHHCTKANEVQIPERAFRSLPRQCPNPHLLSSRSRSSLCGLRRPNTPLSTYSCESYSRSTPLWAAITAKSQEQGPRLSRTHTTLPINRGQEVDNTTPYAPEATKPLADGLAKDSSVPNEGFDDLKRGSVQQPRATSEVQPDAGVPRAHFAQRPDDSIHLELVLPDAAPSSLGLRSEASRQRDIAILGNIKSKSFLERKAQGLLISQRRKRKIERQIRQEGPTWMALAKGLEQHTPTYHRPQEEIVLTGSRRQIFELYDSIQNSKGHQIVPEWPTFDFGRGHITITGPSLEMQEFKSRLEQARKSAESHATRTLTIQRTTLTDHLPTTEPSISRQVHRRTSRVTTDQVAPPQLWTEETLYDYVCAITRSRNPSSASQPFANKDIAGDVLMRVLFRNEATESARSMLAFHAALAYLCEQRKMGTARELMFQMQGADFAPTVETYNILLKGCGKEQNLNAMSHYLRMMHDHDIVPNDGTWLALLLAAPSLEACQVISRVMQRKGLHTISVFAREDASTFVPYSVEPHLASGGDIRQYIKAVDDILGLKWLNEHAATYLIDSLATRGLFMECVGILNTVAGRWKKLSDKECLHKLLRHCVRLHNVDFAIWLLVYARTEWGLKTLDHIILNTVFDLAQSKRLYNLARTVWRYAAAHGELKYKIRVKVLESLRASLGPEPTTVKGRWDASMGAVICEAVPSDESGQTPFAILARERSLYGDVRPAVSFLTAVVEAWLLDREWAATGIRRTTSTAWKIDNCIRAPLVPLTKYRLMRPTVRKPASKPMRGNVSDDDGLLSSISAMDHEQVKGAVDDFEVVEAEEGEEAEQQKQEATARSHCV